MRSKHDASELGGEILFMCVRKSSMERRRIAETININPLTRVEGTGRVKIEVEDGFLKDLQFSVAVSPRFFEYLLVNKQAEDAPRISGACCGISYVNHHLVAVKAREDA